MAIVVIRTNSYEGIVSAPLWNSKTSNFAGLLTSSDYINVIQYYYQYPEKMDKIDQFTLDGLRDVERAIGLQPLETISVHPFKRLYDACLKMIASKGRRIPLIDYEEENKREIVLSVLTQYRILKFVAQNVSCFSALELYMCVCVLKIATNSARRPGCSENH
jgi:5'-AMP-activated protein kinase regulatory gamma subunit